MTNPSREFTYVTEEDILKVDFGVSLEVPSNKKLTDAPTVWRSDTKNRRNYSQQ